MFLSDYFKKRKEKKEREKREHQSWEPRGFLRVLKILLGAVASAFKIALGAAATVACIGIVCVLVFVGLLGNYLQEDIIPEADGFNLENYGLDQTSFVYYLDSNQDIQQLQRIFTSTDRQWANYDEIPEDLIHAAVAIEDKRFYEHQGVDWITTIKACTNMFFGSSSTFGGSTITQQLIKNVTREDSVTVQRKVLEIFRAQLFEKRYDKKVIMEWYLNTIYLGEGSWGVKSAASTYFGKELQMLTTAECASLISITNNPSYYDPYNVDEDVGLDGRANNRKRQETVLWSMKNEGWITEEEYDEAMEQELVFKSGIDDEDRLVTCDNCGHVTIRRNLVVDEAEKYYCPVCGSQVTVVSDASQNVYSWYVDTVLEDVAQDLAEQNGQAWNDDTKKIYMQLIRRGGYHIYTPLNMEVQERLDAVYTNLDEIPSTRSGQQLQSAMVIIDNRTGDIIAMAGGVGQKMDHDAFNRATDSNLQTGSSQKPLAAYAPAFELGVITPATVIKDLPLNYDNGGPFPRNDDYSYSYSRTILSGVTSSVNAVAVNVLELIGTDYSFKFAKEKFRLRNLTDSYISPYDGQEKSDIGLSPLGMGALTKGLTVREMANAYATFANDGVFREARTYTKVYDSDGNLVLDNRQESERILSEKTVTYMNYCLQNAVNSGTGYEARISGQNVAGKTGSTDSYKDRWFCGFTGYYTAATWCGYDTPERIRVTTSGVNNPSAYLWQKVMRPLHEGLPRVSLYDSNMSSVSMCLDSGKIATDACKADVRDITRVASASVYWEDMESDRCEKHVMVDYCLTGKGVANEYCLKFAELEQAEVEKRALVKMTQEEIDELLKARGYGLGEQYVRDDYIYLVNSNGTDANFHGLSGNVNVGVNAPYIVCTEHTKAAWDALNPGGDQPGDEPGDTTPTTPTAPQITNFFR